MPQLVFAASTCTVGFDGTPYRLTKDEAWEADHPLVLARPELFSEQPSKVVRAPRDEMVELAVAVPGEKRHVRRR